eukprot:9312478-Pyramimonas_sp.AAC.1
MDHARPVRVPGCQRAGLPIHHDVPIFKQEAFAVPVAAAARFEGQREARSRRAAGPVAHAARAAR